MSARMLGLEVGWIVMSHIGWGGEQTARKGKPKEGKSGWIVMSHIGWGGEQTARKKKPKEGKSASKDAGS